ncbi:hypothetical protein Tco_0286457 [Tanacetum coccineum]
MQEEKANGQDVSGSSYPPNETEGGHKSSCTGCMVVTYRSVSKMLLTSRFVKLRLCRGLATCLYLPFQYLASRCIEGVDLTDVVTGALIYTTLVRPKKFGYFCRTLPIVLVTNAAIVDVDAFFRSAAPRSVDDEAVVSNILRIRPDVTGPSHLPRKELSIGSQEINSETFREIREMDYHHLYTEINIGTARQACLNAKVRMRTEYCLNERMRLGFECERQADLLKVRDREIKNQKARLLLKEAEATEAARLRIQVSVVEAAEKVHADELNALKQKSVALEDERDYLNRKITKLQSSVSAKDLEIKDFNVTVHALETTCFSLRDQVSGYERLKEQIEEFQYAQMNIVNDKVAKLDADLVASERGLKLAVVKCLNLPKYLAALGAAISRAIEKGMQSGLSAGIDHGKEVDFPLLVELRSHKDASVEDIMNLLRLEGPLADAPGISDLQPDVEQLMLPIHRSEDQVVLGETSLSFALSIAHSRVEKIRENITAQRSALVDVWVPLVEPLSAENLWVQKGNVASFLTVEFKKEELDTTLKRDPPS